MSRIQQLTRLALLLSLLIMIQALHLPQFLTGIAVNALLLATALLWGIVPAMLLGLLSPVLAAVTGILPLVLLPLVPLIMAGNLLYLAPWLSSTLRTRSLRSPWGGISLAGIGLAALLKYLSLLLGTELLLPRLNIFLAAAPLAAFLAPQIPTALAGGILAVYIAHRLAPILKTEDFSDRLDSESH